MSRVCDTSSDIWLTQMGPRSGDATGVRRHLGRRPCHSGGAWAARKILWVGAHLTT